MPLEDDGTGSAVEVVASSPKQRRLDVIDAESSDGEALLSFTSDEDGDELLQVFKSNL